MMKLNLHLNDAARLIFDDVMNDDDDDDDDCVGGYDLHC